MQQTHTYTICLIPEKQLARAFARAAMSDLPDGARVCTPDSLHITLGSVQIPRKQSERSLIERINTLSFPAFNVRLSHACAFLNQNKRDQVLYLAPDGVGNWQIKRLRIALKDHFKPYGFSITAKHPFTPHLTTARIDVSALDAIGPYLARRQNLELPDWRCDRLVLSRKFSPHEPEHPRNQPGADINNPALKRCCYKTLAEVALGRPVAGQP